MTKSGTIMQEGRTEDRSEKKRIDKRKVAAATGFEDFWQVYPKKRKRKQCLDVWKRRKLGTMKDFLIADVESRITGDQRWVKGFVPDPLTYLRGDRWEDELSDQKTSREQTYAEQLKSWIDANATD
jgi:hypothetical protein